MFCPNCGKEIKDPRAKFCSHCRAPLGADMPYEPQAPQAPQAVPYAKAIQDAQYPASDETVTFSTAQVNAAAGGAQGKTKAKKTAAAPRADRPRSGYSSVESYSQRGVRAGGDGSLKWLILIPVLVLLCAAAICTVHFGLNAEDLSQLFSKGDKKTISVSDAIKDGAQPAASAAEPAATAVAEPAYFTPDTITWQDSGLAAGGSQVVLHHVLPDSVLTMDGQQISYETVGTDAVVRRDQLNDVCQLRVVAPQTGGTYVTAAVWFNCDYPYELTMGDTSSEGTNGYGAYAICDSTGLGAPSYKVVNVLTWAYYHGYLNCINDQTTRYMVYSTTANTEKEWSADISSASNAKNTYDLKNFQAVCAPNTTIEYRDGVVTYNAHFESYATNRSTGASKSIVANRTMELVWEDGMWKVSRTARLSDDDYNAGRFAPLS